FFIDVLPQLVLPVEIGVPISLCWGPANLHWRNYQSISLFNNKKTSSIQNKIEASFLVCPSQKNNS
ncbi:hypothetical protein, partial [Staphylococcus aureus]|uniref:hypothetical protein n=1 Tax=Staphylococcus aureus TaxID=1280 RepID=UPI001CC51B69